MARALAKTCGVNAPDLPYKFFSYSASVFTETYHAIHSVKLCAYAHVCTYVSMHECMYACVCVYILTGMCPCTVSVHEY